MRLYGQKPVSIISHFDIFHNDGVPNQWGIYNINKLYCETQLCGLKSNYYSTADVSKMTNMLIL